MRIWQTGVLAAGLVSLWGCGGMSANECALADWRAVGYEDGARGRTSDAFGRYRKSCAKHEMAADFETYQAGRSAGLTEFCTTERGYREGHSGRQYQGVCPEALEGAFMDGYVEGRMLYDLEYAVSSVEREIRHKEARMDDIDVEITEKMADALLDDVPAERRATLIVETKQLAEERIELEHQVEQLEVKLAKREEELAAHRSELVTRAY